ncbi:MAG: ribosome recycling factor [Rickettsiales bacterium]|nr:ribosome recycling factor [Rickettsiales bacterium]|tara:strand:+ start:375 stop:926 length:552 start_codon:yes stop_codon:yes gene_type:complete
MTDLKDLERRMDGAIQKLHDDFAGLRTGRASANMLDPVQVEAYGSHMPLNQVANVTTPEARMLVVNVWDKSMVKAVEKAIANSNLGLNPAADGQTIRVPVPELSEERRKELTKVASQYAENAKVAVRNVRRDGMDSLKKEEKDGDISEDDQRRLGDEIQKMTDKHVAEADKVLADKEKDIMSV